MINCKKLCSVVVLLSNLVFANNLSAMNMPGQNNNAPYAGISLGGLELSPITLEPEDKVEPETMPKLPVQDPVLGSDESFVPYCPILLPDLFSLSGASGENETSALKSDNGLMSGGNENADIGVNNVKPNDQFDPPFMGIILPIGPNSFPIIPIGLPTHETSAQNEDEKADLMAAEEVKNPASDLQDNNEKD